MNILKHILKFVRLSLISNKTFIGYYNDILIERKKFISERHIIIVGSKWKRNDGGRKVHKQIIAYVEDNYFTRFLGFKKGWDHIVLQ